MNHSNADIEERVELHCHTKLGSTGAVNSAAEIIKVAKEGNMSAVQITGDTNAIWLTMPITELLTAAYAA